MGRYRQPTPAFKLQVVREVVDGGKRPAQACREHDSGESLRLRWRNQYAARGGTAFTVRDQADEIALARRVAELERRCGQLALENAVLKKALGSTHARGVTR